MKAIANWPVLCNATDICSFLGFVRYIAAFLPRLAEHISVLMPLTTKDADKDLPCSEAEHQNTFEEIKKLVLSSECLTAIDHKNPRERQIFVICDVSDPGVGAILSFEEWWVDVQPVAFDSMRLTACKKNYPVYEKEFLAIVKVLKRWRYDLLGSHFKICYVTRLDALFSVTMVFFL